MSKIHLNNQDKINEAITKLASIEPNGEYEIEIKKLPKTRTSQMNRALHLYCNQVSEQLNEQGQTVKMVLEKSEVERTWDMDAVKSLLWKPIQLAVHGKKSTAECTTAEYKKPYKYLAHYLATYFGITLPFPNIKDKEDKEK